MKLKNILYMCGFVVLLVFIWLTTYIIRSNQIDSEIRSYYEFDKNEREGIAIKDVYILKNKKNINVNDLNSQTKRKKYNFGDVVDIEVDYEDGSKKNKQAYIIRNSDKTENKVQYQDCNYGEIILPQV